MVLFPRIFPVNYKDRNIVNYGKVIDKLEFRIENGSTLLRTGLECRISASGAGNGFVLRRAYIVLREADIERAEAEKVEQVSKKESEKSVKGVKSGKEKKVTTRR